MNKETIEKIKVEFEAFRKNPTTYKIVKVDGYDVCFEMGGYIKYTTPEDDRWGYIMDNFKWLV